MFNDKYFKNKYKDCFDNIKGDRQLLKAILEKSDAVQSKRIHFKRIYAYAASCAALLVIVCTAFLFNNDIIITDNNISRIISENPKNEIKSTDKTPSASNTPSTPGDNAPAVSGDSTADVSGKKDINKPENTEKNINSGKISAENKGESVPDTNNNTSDYNAESKTDESYEITEDSVKSPIPESSETPSAEDDKKAQKSAPHVSGGAGFMTSSDSDSDDGTKESESNPVAVGARLMANTSPYIFETENMPYIKLDNQTSSTSYNTISLTVFEENINTSPTVTEYKSGILKEEYTDPEKSKQIIIYSSEEELNITDGKTDFETSPAIYKNGGSYSAYIKGKKNFFVSAENISDDYMLKIAESLISK